MRSEYIKFKDGEIDEILCMKCLKQVVAKRAGDTVKRNASWRQLRVDIFTNGKPSYIEPILCADCVKTDINAQDMIDGAINSLRVVKKNSGWTDEQIDTYINQNYNLTLEAQ